MGITYRLAACAITTAYPQDSTGGLFCTTPTAACSRVQWSSAVPTHLTVFFGSESFRRYQTTMSCSGNPRWPNECERCRSARHRVESCIQPGKISGGNIALVS